MTAATPHRVRFAVEFDGLAWRSATDDGRAEWVDNITDLINAEAYVSCVERIDQPGDPSPLTADVGDYFTSLLDLDPEDPNANATNVLRHLRRERPGLTLGDVLRAFADLVDAGRIKAVGGGDFTATVEEAGR